MANDFTEKELMGGEDNNDFSGVSDKEAMQLLNEAVITVDWEKERAKVVDEMRAAADNPEKLWRIAYEWMMKTNPVAKAEVEAVIAEGKEIRDSRANEFARMKNTGMRYGMRLPAVLMKMLTYVDTRINEIESLDPENAKKLYRQIERAFPQFRIPRND